MDNKQLIILLRRIKNELEEVRQKIIDDTPLELIDTKKGLLGDEYQVSPYTKHLDSAMINLELDITTLEKE